MLASYAVRSEESRGRRHPEAAHSYRDDFQRDRDRIIHSRAFRRLENKTQVFTRRYSDHFRNRLTHTIEVAQIARTIAAALELNVDLVESLALVHDIGHPPFGHAGEKALDARMRGHGERFDHNLHALRIVEYFESRYADFRGLNLTFEVREGIIKHSRDFAAGEDLILDEYLPGKMPPLEAQLIDHADEIAYNTADLDDGLESEVLSLAQIRAEVEMFQFFFDQVEEQYPVATDKLKFNESLKRMLDRLAGDLIENTRRQIEQAAVTSVEEVRSHHKRLATFSKEVERQRSQAKKFLYDNLYNSPQLAPDKLQGEVVIAEMFDFWMEHPEKLPATYREAVKQEGEARVVCDYIAGMTDNFILQQHREAFAR